ncbi:MAG: DNA primase [Motiliproteus sp.]
MAGRIPQDFIDDLLHRTDIVDVVEERLQLKRTGRNYSGLCPFHKEKSPSFSVNPEKQFFYCFGCGAGGNALGFVMEHDRLEFPEAVETLAKRQGLEIPAQANENTQQDKQRQRSFDLLQRADDFFQEQLRNHPERNKAVDYLKQRGLDGTIAKRFGIGYAPPGWDNLLKKIGNEQQQALDDAGLVIQKPEQKKCYDRFRDRIMFPIVDMRGRVIAFGGRVLNDEKPKYLNSPEILTFKKHEELYGLYQARQANRELQRVLIVEGYMDVVALAQFGISNAVATLGTATSEHHLRRLYKLMPEVVFCFDGDNAGRKAALRALDNALALMEDGRQARFLFLPDGEDPDSMVRSEGTEAFNQRISQSLPLSQFLFDSLSEGIDMSSGEGIARLSALAMPLINKIPGQLFKQLMRQQLSELSGLDSQYFNTPAPATPKQQLDKHNYSPSSHTDDSSSDTNNPNNNSYESYPDYHSDDNYAVASYDNSHQGDSFQNTGHQNSSSKSKKFSGNKRYKDFNKSPRTSQTFGNLISTSASSRALHLLLHLPRLALKVDLETSDALGALQSPELSLLKALIEQLRNDPNIQPAVIAYKWRDSSYGPLLQQLGRKELLITDGKQLEQEFIDYLHQLLQQTRKVELEKLKAKIKTSEELTSDEHKRLDQLLKDKQIRRKQARQD